MTTDARSLDRARQDASSGSLKSPSHYAAAAATAADHRLAAVERTSGRK
jgi:hypothetical protein